MTPLSLASINGHLPVCDFLVEAGADKEHADLVITILPYSIISTFEIMLKTD